MNEFQENLADTPARTLSERHLEAVRQQGGMFVEAVRLEQPTRTARGLETGPGLAPCRSYSVLLPVGFAVPVRVAAAAVRSYRTLSP